jgi:putative membrane protein
MSAWGWMWMVLALAAAIAVAVASITLAVRSARRGGATAPVPPVSAAASAEQVLADRFARGEIGEDEYWQRVQTLRATDQR